MNFKNKTIRRPAQALFIFNKNYIKISLKDFAQSGFVYFCLSDVKAATRKNNESNHLITDEQWLI
jgi:hypothetical protein